MGEARSGVTPRQQPLLFAVSTRRIDARIVVRHDLDGLHIPLAGQQDDGTGIFEHRHKVWEDIALGVEILAGHPLARALPPPTVFALVEITAMALPQGDMAIRKPLVGGKRRIQPPHERPGGLIGEGTHPPSVDPGAERQRHELFDGFSVRKQRELIPPQLLRERLAHRVVNRLDAFGAERIVG